MSNISDKEQSRKKPRIKKTLEQQLASAQMRLNRLQHKSKKEAKQIETRQKIILGAEVAKALDCDVFTVDKELVLGILLEIPHLHPDDKKRFKKKWAVVSGKYERSKNLIEYGMSGVNKEYDC